MRTIPLYFATVLISALSSAEDIPKIDLKPTRNIDFEIGSTEARYPLILDSSGTYLLTLRKFGNPKDMFGAGARERYVMVNAVTGEVIWQYETGEYRGLGKPVGFTTLNEKYWLVTVQDSKSRTSQTKIALINASNPEEVQAGAVAGTRRLEVDGEYAISPNGRWIGAVYVENRHRGGFMAFSLDGSRSSLKLPSRKPLQGFAWSVDNEEIVCIQTNGLATVYSFPDGEEKTTFQTGVQNGRGDLVYPKHVHYDRENQELVIIDLGDAQNTRINHRWVRLNTATSVVRREHTLPDALHAIQLSADGNLAMAWSPRRKGYFYFLDTRVDWVPNIYFDTHVPYLGNALFSGDLDQLVVTYAKPTVSRGAIDRPIREYRFELGVQELLDLRDHKPNQKEDE